MAAVHSTSADPLDGYGPDGRSPWRDIDWREHQRWVEVGDSLLNVVEMGEGDPVVLVHGHAGSWPNWLEQLPELSQRYRVITFDLPGFGRSPMPPGEVSISGYARTVGQLLDTLGIERCAVIGNSMGGFIAAELALQRPKEVERLVLVSAAGLSTRYMTALPVPLMRSAVAERMLEIIAPLTRVSEKRAQLLASRRRLRKAALGLVVKHPEQLDAALVWELVRGSGRPAVAKAAAAIARYDFRDRLDDIRCPTLIVWGDSDLVVPPWCADEFERLVPKSRKVILADTGHVPMIERPRRFNELMLEFLDERTGERMDVAAAQAEEAEHAEARGHGNEEVTEEAAGEAADDAADEAAEDAAGQAAAERTAPEPAGEEPPKRAKPRRKPAATRAKKADGDVDAAPKRRRKASSKEPADDAAGGEPVAEEDVA